MNNFTFFAPVFSVALTLLSSTAPAGAAGAFMSPVSPSLPVAATRGGVPPSRLSSDVFHGGAQVHGFGARFPHSRLSSDLFHGAAPVQGFGAQLPHSRLSSDIFHGNAPVRGFGTHLPHSRLSSDIFRGGAPVRGFGSQFLHARLSSGLQGVAPVHGFGVHSRDSYARSLDPSVSSRLPPGSREGSGASIRFVTDTAVFTGGRLSIVERIVSQGANTEIFGRYSFSYRGFNATGQFSDIGGIWRFTVNSLAWNASFMINQQGQMFTGDGGLFSGCIVCGGTGNIGAFNGLGNLSSTSGNNNVGLFEGDFNSALYSGNNNVGVLNGNFNGGAFNGNGNFGLLNGNFNGVGYSPFSRNGRGNGNNNYGVFNGNFNGDSNVFQSRIYSYTEF